jgi:hypothetical protein
MFVAQASALSIHQMALFRYGLRLHVLPTASRLSPTVATTKLVHRGYASKKTKRGSNADSTTSDSKRGPITTTSLIPGSQQVLSNPAAREEHTRASAAMANSVEWFKREVAQLDARASGRVTPQLLDPVRVSLPPPPPHKEEGAAASSAPSKVRLEELATVGVRDGSTLVVTVFEPQVRPLLLQHLPFALRCGRHTLTSFNSFSRIGGLALVEFKARPRRPIRRQDSGRNTPARRRAYTEDTRAEVRFVPLEDILSF